jgi:uncharacterized protein YcbK (DUF882 family)|tara:strand:+ start:212 stop:628 length:417 start_codon:yes stop_codon:yes gene_type:complete
MKVWPHVTAVDDWPWAHFTPQEMACQGSGIVMVEPEFMDRLERLRALLGFPLPVTSGYRSPEHNRAVSKTGYGGPHTTGRAADIQVAGEKYWRVLQHAPSLGFTGIGAKQRGPHHRRFIHLDDLTAPDFPRPTGWTYS